MSRKLPTHIANCCASTKNWFISPSRLSTAGKITNRSPALERPNYAVAGRRGLRFRPRRWVDQHVAAISAQTALCLDQSGGRNTPGRNALRDFARKFEQQQLVDSSVGGGDGLRAVLLHQQIRPSRLPGLCGQSL